MQQLKNLIMEKQFVPYELALRLKELGFDRRCFGWYDLKQENYIPEIRYDFEVIEDYDIEAPLWQQAFHFFIHNYGLISIIETNGYSYIFKIQEITQHYLATVKDFETYEEARQACLEKLIELVKTSHL